MALEAFFFPTTDDLQLFGVWRAPRPSAGKAPRVWILCPPFGEEEKSARRVLTQIAQHLEKMGDGSLIFSFRGTGDSEGDFAAADLSSWRADLHAARQHLEILAPHASLGLLGVRLGASLAWQEAEKLGAARLILVEPLLSGRSFLTQQSAKKQIRAQLTGEGAAAPLPADDLDGWPLGAALKAELGALDLKNAAPQEVETPIPTAIFQVGPRAEVAAPLRHFADRWSAKVEAVVMPPFWNLLDATDPQPLLDALQSEVDDA